MAKPKYHIAATTLIFVAVLILNTPKTPQSAGITFFVLGLFGVLADVDHIYSVDWIKNFVRRKKVIPPKGWKNKFHTFKTLIAVAAGSFVVGNYLPILSYGIHMIIDGANRAYDDPRFAEGSYLPWAIHKFYPRWLPSYCYIEA